MSKRLNFLNTCQKCRRQDVSTRAREIRVKGFMGPCGDSFCYGSCDSSLCKPIHATVCDTCAKNIAS